MYRVIGRGLIRCSTHRYRCSESPDLRCLISNQEGKEQKKMCLQKVTSQLLITLLLISSLAFPQKQTPQGVSFSMKYEEGSTSIEKGEKVQVTFGNERITYQIDEGKRFSIPTASVSEVSYDTKSRRRMGEAAAVALLSLGAAAVFMALKTTKHFVNILWDENGTKQEVVFKVGKGEYKPFLAELERATRKEWRNLPEEEKAVREELDQEKKNKIEVHLDRWARVDEVELEPGRYQLVLLQREESKSQLYFFSGKKVKTKKIVVGTLVEVVSESTNPNGTEVIYEEKDNVVVISEIRMPTKALRFL